MFFYLRCRAALPFLRPAFLTLALGLSLVPPASAQNFDVRQALMQMIGMANQQCQMGNQQGCMTAGQLQQTGNWLAGAANACQRGDRQACQVFQTGVQQVGMLYGQVMAYQRSTTPNPTMPTAPGQPINPAPLQTNPSQQMQAIQDFGARNTQNFNSRMQQMDINQQNFLDMLRQ